VRGCDRDPLADTTIWWVIENVRPQGGGVGRVYVVATSDGLQEVCRDAHVVMAYIEKLPSRKMFEIRTNEEGSDGPGNRARD
jgi:hypothetical protein